MFAQKLRELRKDRGLTLDELALLYNERFNEEGRGLNKGTLSKYENEKQKPFIETACGLAEILGVSLDCLMGKHKDIELKQNEIAVKIIGNQMQPKYKDGDIVIIDKGLLL